MANAEANAPTAPFWSVDRVVRHSRDSNFLLFNVFNLQFPRALDTRLSLDLSCCITLCVLNATQTVLIEGWT